MSDFDFRAFLSGIDPDGAGRDEYDQGIPSMLPGGGALGGIGGIVGGIADLAQAKGEIDRQRRLKKKAEQAAAKSRGKLDAFNFDIAQAQRDLATAGIRPTDLTPMQSLQATELAALSTDPRALMGAAGASTARAQQATLAAQQADLGRELGAMQGLADLEQSALEKKQALQLGLQQQDYAMGLQDRAQAQANIEAAKQAKREAVGNIIGGVTNIGASALGAFESGGVIDEILKRQPVQKTEGEFNHDTNKKAIVDEETGVKEGEATGGEYILNPEQGEEIHTAYKSVEQIVESGEEPTMDQLMALYEAVQSVFSQPQFNGQ